MTMSTPLRAVSIVAMTCACGPSIEPGSDKEVETGTDEPVLEPIYGEFEQTELGLRVPVCIPLDDGCLRLSVLINTQERLDQTLVEGELVGPSCAPDSEPLTAVQTFHGTAFTGHGVLWVIGDADLDDGTALQLDVEALQGPCL